MADNNNWGIWSLVCGILAFVVPFLGLVLAVLAIVFYYKQKKIEPNGMATAGMVLGWIALIFSLILIPLMIIGSMAYFGVLAPDRFLPDKCTMNPPFACTEYQVTDEFGDIAIMNAAGVTVNVESFSATCYGDEATVTGGTGEILNGDQTNIRITGCGGGEKAMMEFDLKYTREGETTLHTATGSLQARVE